MKVFIGFFVAIVLMVVFYFLFVPVTIPVLTYHDFVDENVENSMQITKEDFEKEIKYLADHHYQSITLKDMECFLEGKCKLSRKSVLITMDDGCIGE